ncbi:SDR family oxidoreductase [Vibrio sp. TH_r3]|uniref:SDR family NAD(P)-dependent oxidoreductase n=1 Tax=Vibrio sp. TH_r3 TaxID=3082084 RepID=UPI002955BC5A|nr:SDR family oxidoreductase [Vibrio sp. TH_r3]MDV7103609.1 SDR family oxidoreductase [Vibrio sp. TH_r3]
MIFDFSGKTFIVSGAAQGIGAATARSLQQAGATVVCLDRDGEGLKQYAEHLSVNSSSTTPSSLTPEFDCYTVELSEQSEVKKLVKKLYEKYAIIDGFVNAAGGVCGQVGQPLENVEAKAWQAIFDANLHTALWMCQALTPQMKVAGKGAIVTISSGAGLRPSLTGIQAYTSAKHALIGFTKQLAQELGPHGIWVNCIAPGFVLSNPSTLKQWQVLGTEKQQGMIDNINMRRLGSGQDIANSVLFLLSEQANWISGQVLSVDGGHR